MRLKPEDVLKEIDEDELRSNFIKYTIQAFQRIPVIDRPKILDIGCGTGIPTLELARRSGGEVIGLDSDEVKIQKLNKTIEKEGLEEQVKTIVCSMLDIKYPDESFDIIWAEGVIRFIGFERALNEWKRLLKPDGYIVIHDDRKDVNTKLELINICGFHLIEHFKLPDDAWWVEYYEPMETQIEQLKNKYKDKPDILKVLDKKQREVEDAKDNPKDYRSVFYIIQKN
jgi:ubiquinone/menaquinone biosynthesis C-methylase UbiE